MDGKAMAEYAHQQRTQRRENRAPDGDLIQYRLIERWYYDLFVAAEYDPLRKEPSAWDPAVWRPEWRRVKARSAAEAVGLFASVHQWSIDGHDHALDVVVITEACDLVVFRATLETPPIYRVEQTEVLARGVRVPGR